MTQSSSYSTQPCPVLQRMPPAHTSQEEERATNINTLLLIHPKYHGHFTVQYSTSNQQKPCTCSMSTTCRLGGLIPGDGAGDVSARLHPQEQPCPLFLLPSAACRTEVVPSGWMGSSVQGPGNWRASRCGSVPPSPLWDCLCPQHGRGGCPGPLPVQREVGG